MNLQTKYKQLEQAGSALLAVNFYNYETSEGVLRAASSMQMPVILQTSPATIEYLGLDMAVSIARAALAKHRVEGWLHLDHAESADLIRACLDAGYDSVMIDASEKPFKENVSATQEIVKMAAPYGANVEAELGYVAKLGQSHNKKGFTEPDEAKTFVRDTGVDALAVAIGSAHGFYREEPNLDLERLEQIHRATDAALVLHGGSGIPEDQLIRGIRGGIRKINVATEVKDIFMQTLQQELKGTGEIDLRKLFPAAIEKVEGLIKQKLSIIQKTELQPDA